MDPFARKMILAGLAFGGFMLLLAGTLSLLYVHYHPRCDEQVVSQAASPDGQWKAALLERRCGDDAPFLLHVNVRPATDPVRLEYFSGKAEEGEVFVMEEETHAPSLELAWTSPRQLVIQCPDCRPAMVQKRDEHLGAIGVDYQLHP